MLPPRSDAHVGTDFYPLVTTPLPDRDAEPDTGQACPEAALAGASPAEIRSRALKLLTTREHSRYELWRKLHLRGYPAEAVNAVLDALAADGLLSEERLLAAYVAERLDKGFGPLRIRAELQAKGLSDAAIDPHLNLDDAAYLERMTVVDAGKFGRAPADDRQTLAKRARFLEYRGFPAHLIARVLALD
jgi:regulatory protein